MKLGKNLPPSIIITDLLVKLTVAQLLKFPAFMEPEAPLP
jgi:hypothetical protein